MKFIYIILGSISLFFGFLGFVTPGLPVTPLILLTGFFYAKGSPRLYKMLEENKITGRYLNRMKNGFSLKALLLSIIFMWCMVCFTAFYIFPEGKMRYLMLLLGVIGTISQYFGLKREKKSTNILTDKNTINIERNSLETDKKF